MTTLISTGILVFAFSVIHWTYSGQLYTHRHAIILVTLIHVVLVLIWHPGLRTSLATAYSGDSFYTLSTLSAIGLTFISLILSTALITLSWVKTNYLTNLLDAKRRVHGMFVDLSLTVVLFWACVTVVPQIYYLYYRQIISGLPDQWVVQSILLPNQMGDLFVLDVSDSLADHYTGLVLWLLILNTIGVWLYQRLVSHKQPPVVKIALFYLLINLCWQFATS